MQAAEEPLGETGEGWEGLIETQHLLKGWYHQPVLGSQRYEQLVQGSKPHYGSIRPTFAFAQANGSFSKLEMVLLLLQEIRPKQTLAPWGQACTLASEGPSPQTLGERWRV
ncbi:WD repeat-containing protein 75 [Platysternon megacephalum]|uniref:Tapasin-related protein-like n=1 Tax=Platysternon megacephalum TaxID=55544 RepID=A0A4D9DJE3_9SAUR|nr:tapasin-related protein-like [Platysternon megacephalum]TFK13739.1 WD repeat-containing protein 75 [Platysternon megacephalum]